MARRSRGPMTEDGRRLTEEQAAELDRQGELVAAWLEDLAGRESRRVDDAVSKALYGEASRHDDRRNCLSFLAKSARAGEFFPPDLRPCADGCGRRGHHMALTKMRRGRLVCYFCGRR